MHLTERWDGKSFLRRAKAEGIPLGLRIVHVARDAAFQRMLGGEAFAVRVVRERAGHAFDPDVAACLADGAAEILAVDQEASAWDDTLACEPYPQLSLEGEAIDVGRRKRIVPRTANQRIYLQQIRDMDLTFGVGPADRRFSVMAAAIAIWLSYWVPR